jgi:hypothetical protein
MQRVMRQALVGYLFIIADWYTSMTFDQCCHLSDILPNVVRYPRYRWSFLPLGGKEDNGYAERSDNH